MLGELLLVVASVLTQLSTANDAEVVFYRLDGYQPNENSALLEFDSRSRVHCTVSCIATDTCDTVIHNVTTNTCRLYREGRLYESRYLNFTEAGTVLSRLEMTRNATPPPLSLGKRFFVAFVRHADTVPSYDKDVFVMMSPNSGGANVSFNNGPKTHYPLPAHTPVVVGNPIDDRMVQTNAGEFKAYLIEGDISLSVRVFAGRAGGLLALPIHLLGLTYIIAGAEADTSDAPMNYKSIIAVIGTESGTNAEVFDEDGNSMVNIACGEGGTYQYSEQGVDLTGYKVVSTKPVVVYSYVENAFDPFTVTNDYNDALLMQPLPVENWGTNFVVPTMGPFTATYALRVIASQDDTAVLIPEVNFNTSVDAQEYVEVMVNPGVVPTGVRVNCSEPCFVAYYKAAEVGIRPFMMQIPAADRYSNPPVIFSTTERPKNSGPSMNCHVTMVIQSIYDATLTLNGVAITGWVQLSDTEYSFVSESVGDELGRVVDGDPEAEIMAYVFCGQNEHGYGHIVSFG